MEEYTVTVVESGNGLSINIPRKICKDSNILKGDKLTISKYDEIVVIHLGEIIHNVKTLGWTLYKKGTKPTTKSSAAPTKPEKSKQEQEE